MNRDIRLEGFGTISMSDGIPPEFSNYKMPEALAYYANGPWGTICLQEIRTASLLLRHLIFFLQNTVSFKIEDPNKQLQSLISLSGQFEHNIKNDKTVKLEEKQFLLFNAADEETLTTAHGGKICSLLNAHYSVDFYAGFMDLFPGLKKDLKKSNLRSHYFNFPPKVARFTVHDSICAIWCDKYIPSLVAKHLEIRLESGLFSLLAQTYSSGIAEFVTSIEREKAMAAKEIILNDIRVHLLPEQIALQIHCSAGWLKKAFRKVYGMGIFQFLRKTRMEKARHLFLQGESLKSVALEVGMKPSNFPKEFKAYFGYTVTTFKKSLN